MIGGDAHKMQFEIASELVSYATRILADGTPETEEQHVISIMNDLEDKLKAKDFLGLIQSVMTCRNELLQKEEETDVEGCFTILSTLLFTLNESEYKPLVTEFFNNISDSVENAQLRLRILTNMFNLTEKDTVLRLTGLLRIITFASSDPNLFKLVESYFAKVDEFFQPGQLTHLQLRMVYKAIAESIEKNRTVDEGVLALKYQTMYLQTFQNDSSVEKAKEEAVKAAVVVIRNPIDSFNQGIDIAELDAVKQLKGDATHGKLYDLLYIFSRLTLEEYLAFDAKSDVMTTYNLKAEDCLSSIRLLSLCSFAQREEVTFQQITKALQVPMDQVEMWVVKAITCDLVQAKIDQLRQVVTISHCINRQFGQPEWEHLGQRIQLWKKNIRSLLDTIRESRTK